MRQTYDVAIIGAGIVGSACAAFIAQAGLKVVVIERGPIGGGSTASCMGHVVVVHDSEANFALTALSRRLWHELAAGLPADVEYTPCGTIWLATREQQLIQLRSERDYYLKHDLEAELLDAQTLASASPYLRRPLPGGLYVPGDAVVYPPAAARYLLDRACSRGATLLLGQHVRAVGPDGTITLHGGGQIQVQIVINAAGCWAKELHNRLPVIRRKGHLVVTDRYPGMLHHQVVEVSYLQSVRDHARPSVAFNVQPRKTGQILIGSSRQVGSEGTEVEIRVLSCMLQRAVELMPQLALMKAIRAWAGHRPSTPDHLPLIGPSAQGGRIWLATGHEGLGVTTSLATASILTDMLTGRSPQIDPTPYLPSRMIG